MHSAGRWMKRVSWQSFRWQAQHTAYTITTNRPSANTIIINHPSAYTITTTPAPPRIPTTLHRIPGHHFTETGDYLH